MSIDLDLQADLAAAGVARKALGGLPPEVTEVRLRDARLLVSELVTNAVRHAGLQATDRIRLLARLRGAVLRVEVDDPGRGFEPRAPEPDPTRASGWGLYLVDELADRWGVDRGRRGGTRIWFELDAP